MEMFRAAFSDWQGRRCVASGPTSTPGQGPTGRAFVLHRLISTALRHAYNDQALNRLAGSLLLEQNDEWLVSRRYLSETSMAELTTTDPTSTGKELQVV
jgi:hypothetical protein